MKIRTVLRNGFLVTEQVSSQEKSTLTLGNDISFTATSGNKTVVANGASSTNLNLNSSSTSLLVQNIVPSNSITVFGLRVKWRYNNAAPAMRVDDLVFALFFDSVNNKLLLDDMDGTVTSVDPASDATLTILGSSTVSYTITVNWNSNTLSVSMAQNVVQTRDVWTSSWIDNPTIVS
jgi:hypothetical protein